jgi:hypothetical protein
MIYVQGSTVKLQRFDDWSHISVRFDDNGQELVVAVAYLRADNGINEISEAIEALPADKQGKWSELK